MKNINKYVLVILWFLFALSAKANSYKVPNFTTEAYWKDHAIFLVEITQVDPYVNPTYVFPGQALHPMLTYKATERISIPAGLEAPKTNTIKFFDLDFPSGDHYDDPQLSKGDLLLLGMSKNDETQKSPRIDARKISKSPEDPLLISLRQINSLRSSNTAQVFFEAAPKKDDQVSAYSIRRLLEMNVEADAQEKAIIASIQDDDDRPGRIRLLAHELIMQFNKEIAGSKEDYQWLKTAFVENKNAKFDNVYPMAYHLVDFPDRRHDTVKLLTGLAQDPQVLLINRQIACALVSLHPLFHPSDPDADSEMIFAATCALLEDKEADLRGLAAHSLGMLAGSSRLNHRNQSEPFSPRAQEVLQAAEAKEQDQRTKYIMQNSMEGLSRQRPSLIPSVTYPASH